MTKTDSYTQVKLAHDNTETVTFIETRYADTKFQVELEDHPGIFWNVKEVYPSSEISGATAKERAHRWTQYRSRTDV